MAKNSLKYTYHVIYNQIDKIKNLDVDHDTLYVKDKSTGEFIPAVDIVPEDVDNVVRKLKSSKGGGLSFVVTFQNHISSVLKDLNGSSVKVLTYLVGNMKYDNLVFGITYRDIADDISMSVKTVTLAMKDLDESGLVKRTGRKGSFVYNINPAFAWKGNFYKIKEKMELFESDMNIDDKEWEHSR